MVRVKLINFGFGSIKSQGMFDLFGSGLFLNEQFILTLHVAGGNRIFNFQFFDRLRSESEKALENGVRDFCK